MKPSIVRERFTKKKLALLLISLVVGLNMGLAAYFYFSKDMTDWQREQLVDMSSEAGLTRAKIYADSATVGGVSFILCAGAILLFDKLKNRKQ